MSQSDRRTDEFADEAIWARDRERRDVKEFGLDPETVRSEAAKSRADEVAIVRQKLAMSADGHIARAARKLLAAPKAERLSDADYTAFRNAVYRGAEEVRLDLELAKIEKRYRDRITVVKERDPYSAGSPHSWIADVLSASASDSTFGAQRADGFEERLARHGRIVARAVDKRNKYGRAIERAYLEQFRGKDAAESERLANRALREYRATLTTGGGATASAGGGGAAAFLSPQILISEWATYRSPYAAFIGQLDESVPLGPYGLEIYVPGFSTNTSVAQVVEGNALSSSTPTTTLVQGAVQQQAGEVQLSQAVLDRTGPGIAGDVLIIRQLKDTLAAMQDSYALAQVISTATAVTNNAGAFTVGAANGVGTGFLNDVRRAKKASLAAGIAWRATHCFAPNQVVDYLLAWSDGSVRPIAVPALDGSHLGIKTAGDTGPDTARGDGGAQGYSGYVVSSLALFGDDNIATTGGTANNQQIITCRPSTILWLAGEPVSEVLPQFTAGSLAPIVRVRQYATVIPRWSGVAVIGGSMYAAANFA